MTVIMVVTKTQLTLICLLAPRPKQWEDGDDNNAPSLDKAGIGQQRAHFIEVACLVVTLLPHSFHYHQTLVAVAPRCSNLMTAIMVVSCL